MPKILIVEDDPQIARSLTINLRLAGHESHHASTLQEARGFLDDSDFDLICLDIGLPDGSGLEFCKDLRGSGEETPVLFLSALTDEATVVRGMTNGGDDYLRKPFGIEELKVRMQKLMKRFAPAALITVGPLTIDPVNRVVTLAGQIVSLGRKEVEILKMLALKSGNVVTRECILSALYEDAGPYDRTIDSHMSHLRRKLREVEGHGIQINSVYGLGYKLQCG